MRALLLALAAASPCLGQTWTELGPAPITNFGGAVGRVSALATHPTDPSLYYAAGADGGVWRTTDAGATWTPLTDHLPTTAIGALALDRTNPSILYAGSGEGNFANHSRYGLGLYKSSDGGSTWRVIGADLFAGRCFSSLIIHPTIPSRLFAAVTRAGGFPTLAAAKGHPLRSGPTGIYRSDDAGETWAPVAGLPVEDASDVAIDPADPDVMYAAIGNLFGSPHNNVYRSTDGGGAWTPTSLVLNTPTLGRVGLATSPGRVYAYVTRATVGESGASYGLLRSTDGGAAWSLVSGIGGAAYGWYFARVAVHPTNPNLVYAGELSALRSTNQGANLSSIGPPHPDVHAFAWDAAGRLLVGCDGGVYRSAGGAGGDWISLNTGLGVMQFYAGLSTHPTDDRFFLGGLQDDGSAIKSGPGLTWRSVTGGDGGWTQISPHNPAIMFAESQGTGALSRSTNGGASFGSAGSGLSGRNCFLPPYVYDPRTPGRMLYGTERVFVSTNDGASFTALSPDLTGGAGAIRALAIAPSDSRYVYAATNDRRVLASSDGGASFTLRLADNPGWPRVTRELTVDRFDPRTVYLAGAVFGAPHVRRSTDAGASWTVLDGDLPDTPVNVIGVDHRGAHGVIYAGADGGVWRSADGGASWVRHGENLPRAAVVDVHVEPERDRLVVATMGRGAWLAPLACISDFNGDGFTDFFDYSDFVAAFELGDQGADADGSGFLDFLDYGRFVAAFEEGC